MTKESTSKKPQNVSKYFDITELTQNSQLVIQKGNYAGILDREISAGALSNNVDDLRIDGQDLTFTVENNNGVKIDVTVKDYFAKGGKVNVGLAGFDSIKEHNGVYTTYSITPDDVDNNNLFNSYTLLSEYGEKEPKIVKGTNFNDKFDYSSRQASKGGVVINAGAGDDYITGSKGNDTITAGAGDNIINFNVDATTPEKLAASTFGEDTIKYTKDEILRVNAIVSDEDKVKYDYSIDGKNVVATAYYDADGSGKVSEGDTELGKFIVEGAAAKDIFAGNNSIVDNDITFGGESLKHEVQFDVKDSGKVKDIIDANKKEAKAYTGTHLNEVAEGTVNGDTFKLGKGNDMINFDASAAFGDDKVTLTKGENLTLNFLNGENPVDINNISYKLSDNKKDVIVTVKDGVDTAIASFIKTDVTVTDESGSAITKTVILKGDNAAISSLDGVDEDKYYNVKYTWGTTDWNALNTSDVEENTTAEAADETPIYKVGTTELDNAAKSVLIDGDGKVKSVDGKVIIKTVTDVTTGTWNDETHYGDLNPETTIAFSFDLESAAHNKTTSVKINGRETSYTEGAIYNAVTGITGETDTKAVVIAATLGSVTLAGAAQKDLGARVYVAGSETKQLLSNESGLIITDVKFDDAFTVKGEKVTGYTVADEIDLSDKEVYAGVIKGNKTVGYTINAGTGNDIIKGSKFNDTITAGLGKNIINIDLDNGEFGDDIVKVTKGENTLIKFTNDMSGQIALTHNGKDAVITAYNKISVGDFERTNTVVKEVTLTTIKKTVYAAETGVATVYTMKADGKWDDGVAGDADIDKKGTTAYLIGDKVPTEGEIGALFGDDGLKDTVTEVYQTIKTVSQFTVEDGNYKLSAPATVTNSFASSGSATDVDSVNTYVIGDEEVKNETLIAELDELQAGSAQQRYVDTTKVLGTVTVQGIAAKNNVYDAKTYDGAITLAADSINFGDLNNNSTMGGVYYNINLAAKNDKGKDLYIKGDKAAFKGTYENEVISLAGNDVKQTTLSLGGGDDMVDFDATEKFGEVVVNLKKGDNLSFAESNDFIGAEEVSYEYKIDGKDVVATVKYDADGAGTELAAEQGTFRFKNFAAKDNGAYATNGEHDELRDILYDAVADNKGNYTKGTWLNEKAEAKDGLTYKLGLGSNKITYDVTDANKKFATNGATINLTKGEELKIFQTNTGGLLANAIVSYKYASNGKDVTVTAMYDADGTDTQEAVEVGKFIFKGAAAKDLGADVTFIPEGYIATEKLDTAEYTLEGKEIKNKGLSYTGTWLNDIAEGTEKDDKFKLGTGDNTIYMDTTKAIGTDEVTLTKGESLYLGTSEYDGQITYEKIGNDIVAHVKGLTDVDVFTKVATEYGNEVNANADGNVHTMTVVNGETETVYKFNDDNKWAVDGTGNLYEAAVGDEVSYAIKIGEYTYKVSDVLAGEIYSVEDEVVTVNAVVLQSETVTTTTYTYDADKKYYKDVATSKYSVIKSSDDNEDSYAYFRKLKGKEDELITVSSMDNEFDEYNFGDEDNQLTGKIQAVDDDTKTLGDIKFKNYAKDMSVAEVMVDGQDLVEDVNILVNTKGGTAKGTLGNDIFVVDAESKKNNKNTFIETYTADYGYGNNGIASIKGAKDVIQVSASGKADKLAAADFRYQYDENDILSIMSSKGQIGYQAFDSEEAIVDNLANVQFKDAKGVAYQFTNKATDGETASKLDLTGAKTNNIAVGLASTVNTFVDSVKNDIIYSTATTASTWTYTAGVDQYVSTGCTSDSTPVYANDTYSATFGKKTNLEILDFGGNDTLVLTAEKNKTLAADDLMLFFDVEKDNDVLGQYNVGSDLTIMQKDAFAKAPALINAVNNNKFAGGAIEINNYFNGAEVTGVSADNDLTAVTGFTDSAGAGRIETIKIGTDSVDVATKISSVAQEVAGWLANHANYDSAMAVIEAGNKADVQSLLNVYQGATYLS